MKMCENEKEVYEYNLIISVNTKNVWVYSRRFSSLKFKLFKFKLLYGVCLLSRSWLMNWLFLKIFPQNKFRARSFHQWFPPNIGRRTILILHKLCCCCCCCCCCCVTSVVPDSVWPHRRQPTSLLHPWYFPGKSTGVGCHCLLWDKSLGTSNSSHKVFAELVMNRL